MYNGAVIDDSGIRQRRPVWVGDVSSSGHTINLKLACEPGTDAGGDAVVGPSIDLEVPQGRVAEVVGRNGAEDVQRNTYAPQRQ